VTDPLDPPPGPVDPAARRGGLVAGAFGVVALAAAVVVFLAGGTPYGVNIGGGALYLVGLGAALTGSVLLWLGWTDEDAGWPTRQSRRGLATTMLAMLLTCACVVVSLGRVASGGVQLALIAVTAVVLAVAVLLARAPAGDGRSPR
jgi:hypothetical protein